ncbi:MAG: DUF308 domain-containing protein [Methanobrevibacter sp.]|jgi:uncharacterized membrane protein HdeD (DUF308 family)|nr:DUF308 domain-containing protein [Methanobrevibacter sp.]
MENKAVIGILAIILGILILFFPFSSQLALSVVVGIGILILGIHLLVVGANFWVISKGASIAYVILGIISIILGFMLLGNILLFDLLFGLYLYIVGFVMMVAGIIGLVSRAVPITKGSAGMMLILGLLTLILGVFAIEDPLYVAIILGIALIIDGIAIATVDKFKN